MLLSPPERNQTTGGARPAALLGDPRRPPPAAVAQACTYTRQVYNAGVINRVVLSKKAEKDLATVPAHVALKLQDWVEDVEERGVEAVREIRGYHDEPLKGALKGQRSIRLSKGYRAYYRVVKDAVEFLRVEGVDKHVY
jgi:proteic killer suppression protein